jgi:hypothetical protein
MRELLFINFLRFQLNYACLSSFVKKTLRISQYLHLQTLHEALCRINYCANFRADEVGQH